MHIIDGLDELEALAGTKLGTSDWLVITQERVDQFANATLDRQWIHVEPKRAAAESPYGATIAHGFLTLSLLPHFQRQIAELRGISRVINYGTNRVRFPAAVRTGARVRAVQTLLATARVDPGTLRLTCEFIIEIDGEIKPACVAETVSLIYG